MNEYYYEIWHQSHYFPEKGFEFWISNIVKAEDAEQAIEKAKDRAKFCEVGGRNAVRNLRKI